MDLRFPVYLYNTETGPGASYLVQVKRTWSLTPDGLGLGVQCPAVAFSRLSFLPLGRVVIRVMTKIVIANIYGGLTHTERNTIRSKPFTCFELLNPHNNGVWHHHCLHLAEGVGFPARFTGAAGSRCLVTWFGPAVGCFLPASACGASANSSPNFSGSSHTLSNEV